MIKTTTVTKDEMTLLVSLDFSFRRLFVTVDVSSS